jgi:hypothetical protein
VLQQHYDAAQRDYLQAEDDLMSASNGVVDADLDAKLHELFGEGANGKYTREQVTAAAGAVKERYGNDPDAGRLVDYRAAVHVQGDAAAGWLDKIRSDPGSLNLTEAERQLAEQDPVTLAFVKSVGVTLELDPARDPSLSQEEITLGQQDPVLFAFMKLGKVDFSTEGGALKVKVNGQDFPVDQTLSEAFAQGGPAGFATAMGQHVDLGQDVQGLMEATDSLRMEFGETGLQTKSGTDALTFVNTQLDGFFSPASRQAFWNDHAQPVIRPWLELGVNGVEAEKGFEQAYLTTLGQHVNGLLDGASPEVANLVLDLTMARVDRLSTDDDIVSSQVFTQAMSHAVHIADQAPGSNRADEVAQWMLNSPHGIVSQKTASDLNQIIGATGHYELGEALVDKVQGSSDYVDDFRETLRWGVEDGKKRFGTNQAEEARRQAYDAFMDPAYHTDLLNGYFDSFAGSPTVGNPISTQDTPELRNTIGQSLRLQPSANPQAAGSGNLSVDWYVEGTRERAIIDLVVSWIGDKDDQGARVTALPIAYASERDGVEYGALFKIDKADSSQVVIDGSVADDAFLISANQRGIDTADTAAVYGQNLTAGDDTFVSWSYDGFDKFIDENHYDTDGKLYMPKDWRLADGDGDGHVDWKEDVAARTTAGERWKTVGDIGALVVGTVGGVLLAPVTGGGSLVATAAVWTAVGASAGWQIYRAHDMRNDLTSHGQSGGWDNPNIRDTYIQESAAWFSFVPMGTGARATQLARTGARPELASAYARIAKETGRVNTGVGAYFVGTQGVSLAQNWDQMSSSERALGVTYTLFGIGQFGVGAAANRMPRITQAITARSGNTPVVPAAPGTPANSTWRGQGLDHFPPPLREVNGADPIRMRYTRFSQDRGEFVVIDTQRPRGDRITSLDSPYTGQGLQARIRDRAYFLWDAAGRPQGQDDVFWAQAERQIGQADDIALGAPSAARAGDLHAAIDERARLIWEHEGRPEGRDAVNWRQAEAEINAERDPDFAGHWARVQVGDVSDARFFDPAAQRDFAIDHAAKTATFYRRPGEVANELPTATANPAAFADGTRFFSPLFNRDFAYNAAEGRFEPLQAPGAETYYHPGTNRSFIRNQDGGFDLYGLGDNRVNRTADPGLPGGTPPAVAPARASWYFDASTNRTYAMDDRTGRFSPLDAGSNTTHFDDAANLTYVVDLASGRTTFFGWGDNTGRPRSLRPRPDLSLSVRQDRLPDIRAGFTVRGRVKPLDTAAGPTVASAGFAIGTKTNFRAIRHGFVQSWHNRSARPALKSISDQLQLSGRPREYRNIPLSQWGLTGASKQTAFQYKGSTLLEGARQSLLGDPALSPFDAKVVSAKVVGRQHQGPHTIVELSVSLGLKSAPGRVPDGGADFFGTPAGHDAGFVTLTHGAPYDKVMTELKLNQPFWGRVIPIRVGFESRPELPLKDGIPADVVVTTRFLEQNDAALSRIDLRLQVVVTDPLAVKDIGAATTAADIRRMVAAGQIDPAVSLGYVPRFVQSGMRMSAVIDKEAFQHIRDLTGTERTVWSPGQSNLDIIFNDAYTGPARRISNPDRVLDRMSYRMEQRVAQSRPIRWLEGTLLRHIGAGAPQPHYLPIPGNLYTPFGAAHGSPAARYTLSFSTPTFLRSASAEFRVSWKTNVGDKVAPALAESGYVGIATRDDAGQFAARNLPAWFADMPQRGARGEGVLLPVGARQRIEEQILPELLRDATAPQLAAIQDFSQRVLPTLKDGEFIRPAALKDVGRLLAVFQA